MYLSTYTGHCIDLLNMTSDDVKIMDIAHSLSQQCRFAGHTHQFYSVAQHSVRVALALPRHLQLTGLLHDAAEAYVVDLPRPIKQLLPDYRILEERVWQAICFRYGLNTILPAEVKQADERALLAEFREVMTFQPPASWFPGIRPLSPSCRAWRPEEARDTFLALFTDLIGETNLAGAFH
jgi:5'-deoxynucleotidase YfbR-like HD superfamily hydrolase